MWRVGRSSLPAAGSLTGTWSDLGSVTTVDINGGTIDGATVGASSATTGAFTTLIAGDLTVSGTGPHVIGGAAAALAALNLTGAYTSGSFYTRGVGLHVAYDLTGANGNTALLSTFMAGAGTGSTIITQTATESIGVVSTAYLGEPVITDNLTGNITVASTLYIASVPTEGLTNAALYIATGNIVMTGTASIDFSGATGPRIIGGSTDFGILNAAANQNNLNITDAGLVSINDTANANMTIGLNINQGANDDEILNFKSSDVSHGMTDLAEADSFVLARKA